MAAKKVDLDRLATALADYDFAYVISVSDHYRAHTATVAPTFDGALLHVGTIGRHTRTNVEAHRDVTLLWPPRATGGYSLIVDGHAESVEPLVVRPTRAVLHRPATEDSVSTTCSPDYDCVDFVARP
ncbi:MULTISPECIES: pyridoxamine 5'-phosphate oxidase family protein [Mycobacteriaceae]|uniref:Pyridoxamine 5'-phosphate oxidase family protein n=1 Tax=Mycolicibacillus parakoreensis TaxID=1069221 RepID=A0ABY3U4D4_9MYCO|nr:MULTISPECIES: pyridoxamine 5'-phosphate oxidase family protein [Mycobacteriaceae]MCV7315978.1 pyridoxamine 5'-phosphate oxidase family protein [Mycolicibacillus parakoreensis]ULN52392.1 pyridoxamine 5'-phosphate oxidase family protein [Mycolicibacillus parakoreensis]